MGKNRMNYSAKFNNRANNYKEDPVTIDNVVEPTMESEVKEGSTSKVYGVVDIPIGAYLNVRSEKSVESDSIGKVDKDQEVLIQEGLCDETDWYLICTVSGVEGYVLKEYVRVP